MIRSTCVVLLAFASTLFGTMVGPAEIGEIEVVQKSREMMAHHPCYRSVNRDLAGRILTTFCDQLDPLKVYLLQDEVADWVQPSPEMLDTVINSFREAEFSIFEEMFRRMAGAIARRHQLDETVGLKAVPSKVHVRVNEFDWASSVEQLTERLVLMRSVQLEAIEHLQASLKEGACQRLQKAQSLFEQHRLPQNPLLFSQTLCTFIMKAFAEALDSQTAFFTPTEAKQLLIGMQQRLFGIGILLRDDVDGFSVVKIVEGGPAEQQGGLSLGDKIIAVDGDSVIGLDMLDVVEMIRGEPGSEVALKIVRGDAAKGEKTPSEIVIRRGAVVVKDLRYGSKCKPVRDGVIAYLRLHSFYQDDENSSYSDLFGALMELKNQNDVKGVILDLRCNPGGLLTQAVAVAGLFLDKGVVVSIHDESNNAIHMRNLTTKKAWDGPLVVLINRGSASAAEIVAQVLQDWGRAIIIGDDRSFGKGSFQVFTLCPDGITPPSPRGEYKVTRGRYYTVSGKSPQLVGVKSDIVVPGTLCFTEIGEQFLKFPLPSDSIAPNFEDSMEDLPLFQRSLVRRIYATDEQKVTSKWTTHIPELKKRAEVRMNQNEAFCQFVNQLKNHSMEFDENQKEVDYQLDEAWNIMEDLTTVSEENCIQEGVAKAA